MTSVPGWKLPPARLRFSPSIASRVGTHAYKGVRQHGPYDNSELSLGDGALLFVFPTAERPLAHRLAESLLKGAGGYPGFEKMFGVAVSTGSALRSLEVETALSDLDAAGARYRAEIAAWNAEPRERMPAAAIVLVPRSEKFETAAPYYEAKAAFANLAIPTQMVTTELVQDNAQLGWSVANIALALFAKLGGIPWAVDAPPGDDDLIIGIGRADVGPERERFFGYAVTFVNNGIYRQTFSFTPTADEAAYEERLQKAIEAALAADADEPPRRLVMHLAKRAGSREIAAAERAMRAAGFRVPVAFLRLDDSSLHDVADTGEDSFAPPKGLVVKLGPRRALVQTDELSATGAPDGPLLLEMDQRSTVPIEQFDELVAQVFRLAAANWRGFNARSKPATLVYGEQLASLVGHLSDLDTWNPELLRSELKDRPWFL